MTRDTPPHRPTVEPGSGLVEVADRCWVLRHEHLDVSVGVVAGERGLLVVDTLGSEPAARALVEELRRLGRGPVVAVVNTHEHFDHVLGNAVLHQEYAAPVLAHEEAAAAMPAAVERARALYAADPDDEHAPAVAVSRLHPPDQTFASARVVDLGDRIVEAVHPGRGHTAGDVVLRVPDADVVLTGDLVEESALRQGVPSFGDDCYPLEWPATLDTVAGLLTPATVVVPGHGDVVDQEFVLHQRSSIGIVAETIRDLASRGVRPEAMAEAADWPYPAEELEAAFRRGAAALPRGLPLV
jgi:glyoxylase-like metal-dependent hydrolase (beta-lactamase superfamily II)